jgi:sulfoacetaldehyde dehydrogenase
MKETIVKELISRGRAAMSLFLESDQARVDEVVTAIAWSIYQTENATQLARQAVENTGLGNVPDKIAKNQRKTFGTLRDLLRVRTVGIIDDDPRRGIVQYAKPVGVVAAITPSTNPVATPVNKAMMAVKGRNAVVIGPSPAGWPATVTTVDLIRQELSRVDAPADLVQVLPAPVSKERTRQLMSAADLVVVTGSQNNVKSAYSSGTPAIGVGAGNVPVVIDSSADLAQAAQKICASKTFDNSTSCSSENAVILIDDVYDAAMEALVRAGGYRTSPKEKSQIETHLWIDGNLNPDLIARDSAVFARTAGLSDAAEKALFFMVEESQFSADSRFADEKLSLVLTVYRARDFDDAIAIIQGILGVQGRGHSCGIHTGNPEHAKRLAEQIDVVRVLVNQAHTFGNGGSFDNGLNFTLSMGCGTWGGNSISENLSYRHFINVTHLSTTVEEDRPSEEDLFGPYWAKYGK